MSDLMSYGYGLTTAPHGASCPFCDGHLIPGDPCGRCHAPTEVIRSILSRDELPHYIGVLGPSGAGKTVYLGMLLDLLARGAGGLSGMARGAFSMALHRHVILSLERQRFPEKTPSEPDRWQWVHCEITAGRKIGFDLVTPDVAGEAVMYELETPGTFPTIGALIERCSALVVLADIVQIVADGQGQELFAMQLITYLESLRSTRRRKIDVPVAIVFTKADLFEEPIDDPAEFARSNASGLWRLCENRLKSFRFFCSGVAGSCGRLVHRNGSEHLIPLRVEPRGIIEPFAWLIPQIR